MSDRDPQASPERDLAPPDAPLDAPRDAVDEAVEESFPASDPPAWEPLHSGTPERPPPRRDAMPDAR
jgi:hypothetical protein